MISSVFTKKMHHQYEHLNYNMLKKMLVIAHSIVIENVIKMHERCTCKKEKELLTEIRSFSFPSRLNYFKARLAYVSCITSIHKIR